MINKRKNLDASEHSRPWNRPKLVFRAEDYDLFQASVPHYSDLQNEVGRLAGGVQVPSQRLTLIEAGTGTGATSRSVLAAHPGIHLISVDIDAGMLQQASINLSGYRSRVDFVSNDILTFLRGLAPASHDGFVSAYTLHNFTSEYRKDLLAEVSRVLKAGALYINADKIARDDTAAHERDLREQISAFDIYDQLKRPDLRKYWTEHYLDDDKIRIVERDHIHDLTKSGFNNVRIAWRSGMDAVVTAARSAAMENAPAEEL